MALFELTELASWVQSDVDTATATLARDAATAYLEHELNVKLTEASDVTVTYTVRWDDTVVQLPHPTTAVSAVAVDGTALASTDYVFRDDFTLYRRVGWGGSRWASQSRFAEYVSSDDDYVSVDVTMDYGFATPPSHLKHLGLVLAAQAYQLGPKVGLQSQSIDDYSESFVSPSGTVTFGLPEASLAPLRAMYGRGASVVTPR